MDGISWPSPDQITAVGVLAVIAVLVITERLVWHTRLTKLEKERDEWRDLALRTLGVTERMTAPVEVVADVMTRLPDPAAEEER